MDTDHKFKVVVVHPNIIIEFLSRVKIGQDASTPSAQQTPEGYFRRTESRSCRGLRQQHPRKRSELDVPFLPRDMTVTAPLIQTERRIRLGYFAVPAEPPAPVPSIDTS